MIGTAQKRRNTIATPAACLTAVGLVLAMAATAQARVTRITVEKKVSPAFDGATFGGAGQYETLAGKAFGELDPSDPRNAVILAGFQAQGTRGRALQEGAKTLRLFGQEVPVNAEIVELGQFSAHAGKSELLRWLSGLTAPPKQTYLIHGEPSAAQSLQASIRENFKWNVSVARYLDTVELSDSL